VAIVEEMICAFVSYGYLSGRWVALLAVILIDVLNQKHGRNKVEKFILHVAQPTIE
jgi:hypothetical protein